MTNARSDSIGFFNAQLIGNKYALGLQRNCMDNIAQIFFEARFLKEVQRTGYQYLGAGQESVAEHSFTTIFIAYVMSQLDPELDALKLIQMCLLHDLPETRMGDLNYMQKQYVTADETTVIKDQGKNLPFGGKMTDAVMEFRNSETKEARHAHDADQLSMLMELKCQIDMGYKPPEKWIPGLMKRIVTKMGSDMAQAILESNKDTWWLDNFLAKKTTNS